MDDAKVAQFISFTSATPEQAQQYLSLTEGNTEQAVELFFNSGDLDFGTSGTTAAQTSVTTQTTTTSSTDRAPTSRQYFEDEDGAIHIDSDNEAENDDVQVIGSSERNRRGQQQDPQVTTSVPRRAANHSVDDDEAMARRLQEEFYGGSSNPNTGGGSNAPGEEDVRAPIASTRETLIGPGSAGMEEYQDMAQEYLRSRRRPQGRPGIFNQRTEDPSIWNEEMPTTEYRRQLARATGGASERSSKSNTLAEMFRPPFDIMSRLPWDEVREEGKSDQKWILIDVQDSGIFDCQILNRDIWRNPAIKETIREHFIFVQYSKDDPRGSQYMQYYFTARDNPDAYPHVAIVDPRTGEQVKVWSGAPGPKDMDFLMQLHEFLDRYSLNVTAKNPVAKRKAGVKPEKRVEAMTEEEMLEAALQNSLQGVPKEKHEDPDELTRNVADIKGKSKAPPAEDMMDVDSGESSATLRSRDEMQEEEEEQSAPSSPFAAISASHPHTEPELTTPNTRIQFRHPSGRVVRRFALADPVRRLYEWLKASPLEGKEGVDFELVSMQKNLLDSLDQTVEEAGLKNGTVMVEFVEKDD
ncbi:hypothetical protein MMC25_002802 [Agyrium rufum]|nr:hypothetical protein [Agyrium rufum]